MEGDKERVFRVALRGVVIAIYIVVVPYLEMVRTEGAELTDPQPQNIKVN